MTSIPASHRDLLDAQVATFATIGADEHPHLTELWFLAEDGVVRLSLNSSRQKVKNLRRNPACSLLILDLANPYRYVEIRGDAQLEPDPDYAFAERLGAKYGADLRSMDEPGETRVVVTVHPTHIHTWG
ncbi:MAG TPA: PPOX class F420-dependent oxidoreductase [Jatrophihabitans sp.]|nr:PPOX class F420-dependent oxidoreductase [Jatrophihabitans sp.]